MNQDKQPEHARIEEIEGNLADVVQTVFDALQDKIDATGPIAKSNLQLYVNMLRDAFVADLSAPQAQEVQLKHWLEIGKAVERACVDLPEGWEIIVALEKGAGTVTLADAEGDEQENFPTDGGLSGILNAAIDAAIAASAKGGV